jgi:hypothetical protein
MLKPPLTIGQILALMAETPVRVERATSGIAPALLHSHPGSGQWSANEVLAHVRACADMGTEAIREIMAGDMPVLLEPADFRIRPDYVGLDFEPSLRAFAAKRAELLGLLTLLPEEGWSRAAKVKRKRGTQVRTLNGYGQWMARHEHGHAADIERIARVVRRKARANADS